MTVFPSILDHKNFIINLTKFIIDLTKFIIDLCKFIIDLTKFIIDQSKFIIDRIGSHCVFFGPKEGRWDEFIMIIRQGQVPSA